ncbi:unnamed protein product [Linum tenue]|uniref:MORF/ORRM1/DAG-like MORF domain-containing protein n=1 Tax=Linum tenue TaxID=586396 RepID=A0AAV0Q3Q3_9ROSI|nr:unnamed protein product [Linum tenue]
MAHLTARRTLASILSRALSSSSPSTSNTSLSSRFRFASALLDKSSPTGLPPQSFNVPTRFKTSRSGYSPLNDPSPNWSNRPPKETIMLDGCDYEHWLIVMEFANDPKPSEEEMINSYVKTLAAVVGSEEEAKKKIYSVATKTYTGFGALISEELSYKAKELPGVLWVLPDSYLDVPNKDYGGDLFVDGKVIHRPQYWFTESQNSRHNRPRPRYDRRRETMQVRRDPVQTLPPPSIGAAQNQYPPQNAGFSMNQQQQPGQQFNQTRKANVVTDYLVKVDSAMNSNYGKGSSGSMNNFNFDLGLGSNRSKPLNEQRNQNSSGYSSYSYSSATGSQPRPAFQPGKPSWTHQPAAATSQPARAGLEGPNSMVGDIFGKTWGSTGPAAKSSGIGIGVAEKNPNLFGDLVSSALGQGNKSGSNAPLKNATPTPSKSSYSMGNMADSLPKVSSNSAQSGAGWGSNRNVSSAGAGNVGVNGNKSTNTNLGGSSMKGMAAASGGIMGGNKDPFVSLVDFSSKPSQSGSGLNSGPKGNNKPNSSVNDPFGDFQTASKPSSTSTPSSGFGAKDPFGDFPKASKPGSTSVPSSGFDFGMPSNDFGSQKQTQSSVPATSSDPLGMFFNSSAGSAAPASSAGAGQQFSELDDWGVDSGFDGADGPTTTELEGLPPPPAGVSASAAKSKGVDHQKQGQYADAIKWLSWAVVLLEKSKDKALSAEVLSTRASCYKEVGEYKKAVADCTMVLEGDETNVSVLVQRALLYESMEKYRLGAEDLRAVLKIDPANRIARSTVHRLSKMAD